MAKYLILTILPALITILWALTAKIRQRDWLDVLFLFVAGVTLALNGIAVYFEIICGETPLWIMLVQMLASPTIVPQAYAYFCRQMGTKGSKHVTRALWLLMLLLFLPSLNVDIHPSTEPIMHDPIRIMHFNVFDHGSLIYVISIPSLIILFQAIATMSRIPVVTRVLHMYELKFSANGKTFIAWWMAAIIFIIFSSLIEMDQLRQPVFSWAFFGIYSFLICIIFGRIALGLDIQPIETSDEQEIDNMDAFIEANHDLAQRAQRLFMEEKLYLRQGIVTDDVVKMLGTNRTYFTRMMRAEFNMSFNEFITSERIAYSKQLLSGTDKTLEEIAMDSGFSNASAYCRVFKRLTGVSPDAWRRDHHA